MRLLILSDLHHGEGGSPLDPSDIRESFDIAIVAGDCAGRLTSSLAWLEERFAGTPTIYVPGNHDFYRDEDPCGFTMEDELDAGREAAARLDIHLLSDDGCEIGGLRFLGATLWTDLRASLHWSRSQAFAEARRWMNDYRRIHRRSSTRRSRRIRPEDTLAWHRRSRTFLEAAFAEGGGDRTIVVTHHAPSRRSLTDPFDGTNHCYASDLEAEIGRWRPALWVHGHIHRRADYLVGATRIVCNPLGRADEDTGFDAGFIVTVD